MKRYLCIFLWLMPIFMLCSCTVANKQIRSPVTYYYRTAEANCGPNVCVISTEIREAKGYTDDYQYLISQYLNGPRSSDCISPFPAGITLEEFNLDSNKVQIKLSPHLALLSGSELMLACACLTNTITQMTGVDSVQISAENGLLNNQEYLTLTANSFTYFDLGSGYVDPA